MVGLIYTASIAYMIILSQHLVPRDNESPAIPPISHFGGTVKTCTKSQLMSPWDKSIMVANAISPHLTHTRQATDHSQ